MRNVVGEHRRALTCQRERTVTKVRFLVATFWTTTLQRSLAYG
jgi:hypothetical protein